MTDNPLKRDTPPPFVVGQSVRALIRAADDSATAKHADNVLPVSLQPSHCNDSSSYLLTYLNEHRSADDKPVMGTLVDGVVSKIDDGSLTIKLANRFAKKCIAFIIVAC